jgi:hypothetical protein
VDAGQTLDRDALLRHHPDLALELAAFFANQDAVARMAQGMADPVAAALPAAGAPTLAPGQAPALGSRLRYFGDYELPEEIARDGMGVVYRARQVSLNRIAPLEMIPAGQLGIPSPSDGRRERTCQEPVYWRRGPAPATWQLARACLPRHQQRGGQRGATETIIGCPATIHSLGVCARSLDEIEHFFIVYNEVEGRQFKAVGRHGPERAKKLITAAMPDRPPKPHKE